MLIARPFRQGASRLLVRYLTAFLVFALLLCHGAFGGLHQVSAGFAGVEGAHHVPAGEVMSLQEPSGDYQGSQPPGSSNYTAALSVTLLLGTVLLLALSGGPARRRRPAFRIVEHISPPFLRPIRGPTVPLLQVFRL